MENVLTLADVVSCFNKWRAERKSRAESIPKKLRMMAASLYPKHKKSVICQALSLSGRHLSQYIAAHQETDNSGFVTAQAPVVSKTSKASIPMTLNGKERSLHFCVEISLLPEVIEHIAELL